jgi:ATP-binding cassette, subfamily G (WHITE), eye pigment precursor transporter
MEKPRGDEGFDGAVPKLAVEWANVGFTVRATSGARSSVAPTRHILRGVSGEALPGELMVLMGPSGAGKSTLLDCIAGRNRDCTGEILVNGKPWNALSARRACYVMQDDLFYANLTVLEHLTFQAQLRMGGDSVLTRQQRVDAVVSELGLSVCKHTRIGDPANGTKGLSGGQRKRLALATELLTNPSLLFVDEPTSGLDSFMAETVVRQMRELARRGRTVIATIHQPSSQLFALFDRLFLLVNGRTVFHGRADASLDYFASVGWPCPAFINPTDHFMTVLAVTDDRPSQAQVVETLVEAWHRTAQADDSEAKQRRQSVYISSPESLDASGNRRSGVCGRGLQRWLLELGILSQRHWFRLVRDDVLFKARIGSTIFVDLLAGLVFRDLQRDQKGIQDFTGALFFISVSQLFMYSNPELTTVPLEIPLILREHNGRLYHIWTWFLAKNLTEVPLQLVLPLVFLVPMYFLIGFDNSVSMFFQFYAYTVVVASCATALGYCVSCIARRVDIAPILGVTFMLPFILFGGMFLNSASTPIYFRWLQAMSPVMYVFHCLMRVFWLSVATIECRAGQFCVTTKRATY